MIVGKGLIASAFTNYDKDNVVFFASGVSNSLENNDNEFLREENLIKKVINENPEKIFLYFSTCSIYDSTKFDSKYVLHKQKMEQLIIENCKKYLIARISNVVGKGGNKNTLVNYLYDSIQNERSLIVYSLAKRNLIDIEDIKNICLHFIKYNIDNQIINIASPENYFIEELIHWIEEFSGKKAIYRREKLGEDYPISITDIQFNFQNFNKEKYFKNILKKYYS